jgi:hypothetical protein
MSSRSRPSILCQPGREKQKKEEEKKKKTRKKQKKKKKRMIGRMNEPLRTFQKCLVTLQLAAKLQMLLHFSKLLVRVLLMSTRKRGAKTPGKTPGKKTPGKTPGKSPKSASKRSKSQNDESSNDMVLITREELEELREIKQAWEKAEV